MFVCICLCGWFRFFFFFFSSRRRHTRSLRDWSSDVCSSDLEADRDIAGREAKTGADAVGPLVVVLEVAAPVLARIETQDGVGGAEDLPAEAGGCDDVAVPAENVANRIRARVIQRGRDAPLPQAGIGVSTADDRRGRGQKQTVAGRNGVAAGQENNAAWNHFGKPGGDVRDE